MDAKIDMRLPILEWPHPVLRSVAIPVDRFDHELHAQIDRMWETMYEAPGVGLAAPQIGDSRRIFVMDCGDRSEGSRQFVCINPSITKAEGQIDSTEGCLSFPGLTVTTPRAERVELRAQDERGHWFEAKLSGLEAVCAQHELDHLDGKSFLDALSPIERLDALQSYLDHLQTTEFASEEGTSDAVRALIDETLQMLLLEGANDE